MSTHTEVTALKKHGLPETLRTLMISPELDLEPGTRLKASFMIGDGPPEVVTVTVRVGFESDKTKGVGSTVARWTIRPNEEIELIVALPGESRTEPGEGRRDEPRPSLQQALPPALRLLEEMHFPGFVRHLFMLRALLPEDAFSEKIRGQLDRLFIKLRLPNYVISERDIETTPHVWIHAAQRLSGDGLAAYRARFIAVAERCSEPEEFIAALQNESPELDAALDALLDRMRACS